MSVCKYHEEILILARESEAFPEICFDRNLESKFTVFIVSFQFELFLLELPVNGLDHLLKVHTGLLVDPRA